ncbi:MAG: glycosyltransferase family 4 protein [Phycisphaeraceae bacterium]|nr:glycosyltransferase family 4 protein [Phycisphaeraceae bacterium]
MSADGRGLSVLYLAPSFLAWRRDRPLRGVEIFDLLLIRQLAEAGVMVRLPAEKYWRETFERELDHPGVRPRYLRGFRSSGFAATVGAWLLRKERYDALVIGNNSRGLMPAIRIQRINARRTVLIANRRADERFLRAIESIPMDVMAVSEHVADSFRGRVSGRLGVNYGIVNAEAFHPPGERAGDGVVRFCVLGRLENEWKGAGLIREAFEALEPAVRSRCELHLASYVTPPEGLPAGIVAHRWMPSGDAPAFLRSMDVYVAASTDQETFGQTVVQAMLTGLPVIATPARVQAEKLDSGGGIVCENARAMTDAMARLAQDAQMRRAMGASARETALARYVWSTSLFIDRYLRPEPGETSEAQRREAARRDRSSGASSRRA